MGKCRRYNQDYKDMILELFKSGISLAQHRFWNIELKNQ